MPRKSYRPTPLALSCAAALALWSLSAQAETGTSSLTQTRPTIPMTAVTRLSAPENSGTEQSVTIIRADRMEGSPQTTIELFGNAEIRQPGQIVRGDKLTYTQRTDLATAEGNAAVARGGMLFEANKITYRLYEQTGEANDVEYEYAPQRMRGSASCVRFLGEYATVFDDAQMTTCRKGDNSWWIELDKLTLDEYDQSATAQNAVFKIADGYPVFYVPWFSFPMGTKRKSGFLIPTLGLGTKRGFELVLPYYFNIAPNYDLTVTPHYMSKRGVALGTEMRWLNPWFASEVEYHLMPHDKRWSDDHKRYTLHARLAGARNGFTYGLNFNRVSDKDFFEDIEPLIKESEDDVIPQDYWINYRYKFWNAGITVKKNQTIGKGTSKPYEKIPEITWNAFLSDIGGFELKTVLQATRFRHPKNLEGDRFIVDQKISYPMRSSGWFLTPAVQMVEMAYDLDSPYIRNGSKSPQVFVPTYSIDSGLFFERDASFFGKDFLQTLEPRLYYSYTPRKYQADIPVFDASKADMNFSRLFTANTYTGYDRINSSNQITGMVTNRLLDYDTGAELGSFGVGLRYNFTRQNLKDNGKWERRKDRKEDLLLSFGAQLTRSLSVTGFYSWNYVRHRDQMTDIGIHYQPTPASKISLEYHYNYEPSRKSDDYYRLIDLKTSWPLSAKWYLLTLQSFSVWNHKLYDNIVALEYQADCWTSRFAIRRYTDDDDNSNKDPKTNTQFFVQFELRGLGSIVGDSPLRSYTTPSLSMQNFTPSRSQTGTYDYYY